MTTGKIYPSSSLIPIHLGKENIKSWSLLEPILRTSILMIHIASMALMLT
jgi:hypothetical protein